MYCIFMLRSFKVFFLILGYLIYICVFGFEFLVVEGLVKILVLNLVFILINLLFSFKLVVDF